MLFNSVEFLIFFPIVTILFFSIPHKFRWSLLLTASCIFYMAFVPYYILILFFTITIDYVAGIMIEQAPTRQKKKKFLLASLCANIGILIFFKYFNFININIGEVLHIFSLEDPVPLLKIALPIGLSFHTFQAMSYTIEIYRGNFKAEKHFGYFGLYVMFYPQLVAGPIERPQNLLPQLKTEHQFNTEFFTEGILLMIWGFVKKTIIADRLSVYTDEVFRHPADFHSLNLLLGSYFFYIRVYCDFSGYADIALGSAKTMGINLTRNFNHPLFSENIRDFWQRWNISLTSWFRDYVFFPLGGFKNGFLKLCRNIVIIFLLSGLWHGANWTFIVWGAIHALFIVIYLLAGKYHIHINRKNKSGVLQFLKIFFTFNIVALSGILFGSDSLKTAWIFFERIFSFENQNAFLPAVGKFNVFSEIISVIMIVFMLIMEYITQKNITIKNLKFIPRILFASVCIILIISLGVFSGQVFVYFQF